MTVVHITQKPLAERWAMSPKSLERWRCEGNGPRYLKLGASKSARVIYRLADVEEYEAACFKDIPIMARAVAAMADGVATRGTEPTLVSRQ